MPPTEESEPGARVRVWRFALDAPPDVLRALETLLTTDELARADRLRGEGLRRRFVAGRGTLRRILGAALGAAPAELAFAYGDRGKPRVVDAPGLEFNLAHTGGAAVCALTTGRAIGVDIEEYRPMENAERIIGRYFTPREQADFLAHPEPERLAAFYRGWTRKEAFLKATGEGLAASLDSFEVALAAPGVVPGPLLLRVGDDPAAAGRWTLRDIDAGPAHAAALVVAGRLDAVEVDDWRHEVDAP